MSSDIVKFRMPDGTEVSNDPRWLAEQKMTAQQVALGATPNTGTVGIPDAEMAAQIGGGMAPGQSGQPGVGEAAVASEEELAAGRLDGRVVNLDLADSGDNSSNEEGDPKPDSNEAVLAAREAKAEADEKAAKALQKLADKDQEPGDPDKALGDWTAAQLSFEIARRNQERDADDMIDSSNAKRKSDLVTLLEQDNEAGGTFATADDESNGDS